MTDAGTRGAALDIRSFDERALAALLPAGVIGCAVTCRAGNIDTLAPLFPEEIDERLLRSVEKRQREFRAGRDAARRALSVLGVPACSIPKDPTGPPCFPAGITGSITHAGRDLTLAISVATREPILLGVDAEEVRPIDDDVTARVVTKAELAAIARLGFGSLAPLVAFSAKEAVYKALYPRYRTFLEFHDVQLTADDGALRAHAAKLNASASVRVTHDERWLVTFAST